MSADDRSKRVMSPWVVVGLVVVALAAANIWANFTLTRRVEGIISRTLAETEPEVGKTREELIALRIQNERNRIFLNALLTSLIALAAPAVAITGAYVGFRNYLDTRTKERLDRVAGEFSSVIEGLVSDKAQARAFGAAGLQHFFSADKQEYHLRALSALATAARTETESNVLEALRITIEYASRQLPPGLIPAVSWRGTTLKGVHFQRIPLIEIDLTDADLENANLSGCDLSQARLENATLKGAKLDGANLRRANCVYADFAGASLIRADLREALLYNTRVLRMDLRDADLRGAQFDVDDIKWELVANWRLARFDDALRNTLTERLGPQPRGPRVLMLMWEVPPLVAGGTWTASYHLVRNLRQAGADVTVVVPWEESWIVSVPFGAEVEVVSLGMVPPEPGPDAGRLMAPAWSPYQSASWSPYQSASWSPYQGSWSSSHQASWWSPYQTAWSSPYGFATGFSPYASTLGPYGWGPAATGGMPGGAYGDPTATRVEIRAQAGSIILRLIEEFKRRLVRMEDLSSFQLIHAHDWVVFPAAEAAASAHDIPWVAHFHSTLADRDPGGIDVLVSQIERQGGRAAHQVVVPSKVTARRVRDLYGVAESRITVAPNPLSSDDIPVEDLGTFETRRTVFLGRLTPQKGPDLFVGVARVIRQELSDASFRIYGAGPELSRLMAEAGALIEFQGPLMWAARGAAFGGASAVLVTSRFEPFGMVIAEAMLHQVPVLYPEKAGIGEVLEAGIRIDPENVEQTAAAVQQLLIDVTLWEQTVDEQKQAIGAYMEARYEQRIRDLWDQLLQAPVRG